MDFFINWMANVPPFAVPFALAALGLIVTEKSGVLSLGAEGYLLVGAMAGVGCTLTLGGYPLLAIVVAALATAVFSMIFAAMVVSLRVNQVIAGLAMVFLAQGLTGLIATQQGWTNQPVAGLAPVPLGPLSDIPVLGPLLFDHDAVVYLTGPIFAFVAFVLTRSMVGLRLRAVGDGPDAADAAGINVALYRYLAIAAGAALVGLAGGYLSVGVARIWVDGMAGGRGWIAIALVIFARWHPWRALAGALLFGSIEALIPRIAAVGLQVPQYFVLMAPYLATLAVMIWTSLRPGGRLHEPQALGQAHLREERR
ncbi:ABC transporter permease [Hyphomicrobium sp. CS1GBMeth3]|uniref:ABC transporter permease n=1 Tax=Hyphomicrobium sp. CS1GBMeth3 TaxID=1892845 RepID=UPI000931DE78|nr:ABC transporter permease [Hyphomicrobium sp. CS1GBMeth3]